VVARQLGRRRFGELGIIESTVGLFGTYASFGLGAMATKHIAEHRERDPVRAGRILALSNSVATAFGVFTALTLFCLGRWLAGGTLAAPHLTWEIQIASALVLLGAINAAQTGALAGFEAFRTIATLGFVTGLASVPILVAGAMVGGLTGVVWAMIGNLALTIVITRSALSRTARSAGVPISYWDLTEWRVLLSFSLPMVISSTVVTPVSWASNAIIVNQPSGYDQIGIFNAANRWFAIVVFIPSMVLRPMLPTLSERFAAKDFRAVARVFRTVVALSAATLGPVALVLALGSRLIMRLYGREFESGWLALCILLATALLYVVHMAIFQCLFASGRMWLVAGLHAVWGAAYVTVVLALRERGAFALATAGLAAHIVCDALAWQVLRHLLRAPTDEDASTYAQRLR
jgi:O-antigen/teichoic acid export membrane protein